MPIFLEVSQQDKPKVLTNLKNLSNDLPSIINEIRHRYGRKLLHLSLAGSAIFKGDPRDLDFNIILEGSIFDYSELFKANHRELCTHSNNINKLSFITFGEEDISKKTNITDSINTTWYCHEDVIARELLVYRWRNLLLYGYDLECSVDTNMLQKRLLTGLSYARRLLLGQIGKYETFELQRSKALSRLDEAIILLKILTK
ncbi:MAG TPA: hypothetical protein PKD37_04515 [Oligoflexia bacterium]|nr:hypothetical protein [Oligoflexia bacterium]HMP27229.1 hypothetical protein [Oligoflexia bacterium]